VARKLRGFERVLDAPVLFAIAYDEIASSLYFALGVVVAQALGLTPIVLLLSGGLFLIVSLSYAEGTAAIPETGGAATLVRRTFNDGLGFVTGWALLLDYLIVIALSTLFLPNYLSWAVGVEALRESPWDVVVACAVIAALVAIRLIRHSRLHVGALVLAGLDLVVQAVLVVLGFTFLFSTQTLTSGFHLAAGQGWHDLAFAIPLAMLAYTGLETVANLAEETREPGKTLPASLFSAIGLVVAITVLISIVGVTAYPAVDGSSALGEEWLRAPLVGIVEALQGHVASGMVDVLRVVVGISGALILLAAATTSMSGCTRLLHSMGEHGQLPRSFGRLGRRSLVAPAAIGGTGIVAIAIVVAAGSLTDDDVTFLASAYSFGVLLAFTAAQAAVIRLRRTEPGLARPFRARPSIRWRGVLLPLPALIGAPITFGVWILAMVTHPGARYAGPAWLLGGIVVYLLVRRRERHGVFEDVDPIAQLPPGAEFARVLVPMKLGDIGEEMVATAVALAKERGATVQAIFVVRVPREFPLEGPLPPEVADRARLSLEEARALGEDNGVEVETDTIAARSIGHAIVDQAVEREADLIVLGSSPRWRRQSRFFSPTVDYVLRHAPCQVLVVAFPDGVFEEDGRVV
jgi:APA family basic amino acid/polyamine antiporter